MCSSDLLVSQDKASDCGEEEFVRACAIEVEMDETTLVNPFLRATFVEPQGSRGVGAMVGLETGFCVGLFPSVGFFVGLEEGFNDGFEDGLFVGFKEGLAEFFFVGILVWVGRLRNLL